jgi:hypothetical protein
MSSAAVAVVDLTDGLPSYGVNDQEHVEKHIFSLAKVIPLFVAYRLQERLQNQFAGDPATTAKQLVANVEAAWKSAVQRKGRFKTGYTDFPNLLRIFDLPARKAGGTWEFKFRDGNISWPDLETFEEQFPTKNGHLVPVGEVNKKSFKDRLKLSVRMSDNNAAGSVAHDIGLSYILGTLKAEGYYSDANHGLWFSNTYGYDNVRDEDLGGYEAAGDNITAGGTAYSLAALYTLLAQQKLVSPAASAEMLDLLQLRGVGYGSWYSSGLPAGAVTHSKVGLGDWASEAAIIQYTVKRHLDPVPAATSFSDLPKVSQALQMNAWKQSHPIHIKYVVVALEVDGISLADLISKIDPFIRSEHAP